MSFISFVDAVKREMKALGERGGIRQQIELANDLVAARCAKPLA